MDMKKKKRGRQSLGGLRVILRLLPSEVELLERRQKETGLTRTEMIRRAIDHYWSEKRRETNWRTPPMK
jgi:hypothetical protein